MKKLIIVRHAKSSWDLQVADHNRPLAERGIRRAQNHAMILKDSLNFEPAYWVSSFANRALHTAVLFSDYFGRISDLHIKKEFYTFNSKDLISQIKTLPADHDSVILFSHNDACHKTVIELTGEDIPHFKTASVAVIYFDEESWDSISNGKLKLLISKGEIVHGKES